jgi:hypothetical protein
LISLDLSLASLGCNIGLLALLGDGGLSVLTACGILVALLLNMAWNTAELAGDFRLDCCVCSSERSIGGAEERPRIASHSVYSIWKAASTSDRLSFFWCISDDTKSLY